MQFPVTMEFKMMAMTPQITMTDANGQGVVYVKQKMVKLKESINVFSNSEMKLQLYQINGDKVLDFSARYRFTDMAGKEIGAVKRQGKACLWQARYDVLEGEQVVATIKEKNPWIKVGDTLFGQLPIVGMFTGYVFNPSYEVIAPDGTVLAEVTKQASFSSRTFVIEKRVDISATFEDRVLLAVLMMTLRERSRG